MSKSFQYDDWKAIQFDQKFAGEMCGMDIEDALHIEGDTSFVYTQLEYVIKSIACEIWPIEKTTNDTKGEEDNKQYQTIVTMVD